MYASNDNALICISAEKPWHWFQVWKNILQPESKVVKLSTGSEAPGQIFWIELQLHTYICIEAWKQGNQNSDMKYLHCKD